MTDLFQVERVPASEIEPGERIWVDGRGFMPATRGTGGDLYADAGVRLWNVPHPDRFTSAEVPVLRQASPVVTEEGLKAKLEEMRLYDDTGNPLDVGYMRAVSEIDDWLASQETGMRASPLSDSERD